MGVSHTYLTDLLRSEFQCTWVPLVNRLRIKRAVERLETGSERITEIAYALGFENPGAFGVVFRREMGMSPGEYRRLRS